MSSILISIPAFAAAFGLSLFEKYVFSGCVLLAAGILICYLLVKRQHFRSHPAALFSLSWLGGCGLSCMKLSHLQLPWETETWVSFLLAYLVFMTGFLLFERLYKLRPERREPYDAAVLKRCLYTLILGLSLLSLASFLLEALLLGYVPLFTVDTPHAYSYFHISGLHYLTVSYVLVPSFAVLYVMTAGPLRDRCLYAVLACCVLSFCMAVLLVSRSQLIFSVLFAFFTFCLAAPERLYGRFREHRRLILPAASALLLALYVWITFERAHSASYLMDIFEMKDMSMPVWLAQPYIYIAHNYDNFNCLVRELPAHTFGLKSLFPFFALTGLKFLAPSLVAFPLYITKEELGTLTLFYDAYYDGGLFGVALLAAVLGMAAACFAKRTDFSAKKDFSTGISQQNPVIYVLGGQYYVYLLFSFFTTWFSNPATWYYAGVCVAGGLYISYRMHHVSSGV